MPISLEQGAAIRAKRWDAWKEKASAVHNGKYSYPSVEQDDKQRIRIICPEHGEFWQRKGGHMFGKGCPKCDRKGLDVSERIEVLQAKHPDLDFSKAEYVTSKTPLLVSCPVHGEFSISANHLLTRGGCPKCGTARKGKSKIQKPEAMEAEFRAAHGGKYQYDWATYTKATSRMRMVCDKHGEFWQKPTYHRTGVGCPECGKDTQGPETLTTESFIKFAKDKHGGTYNYDKVVYVGSKLDVVITCKQHGDFPSRPNNHLNGAGCPKCTHRVSSQETEILKFLEEVGEKPKGSAKKVVKGELDILLPERNLAIEYNGLYWHGELFKTPEHLLEKTTQAEASGVRLIHIFEDEWLLRPEAVKARLLAILGKSVKVGGAREFEVRTISWPQAESFLDIVHLQGAGTPGRWCLGLMHGDEVMACMTIGKARYGRDAQYEILRFASLGSIPGGFSKLLKAWAVDQPKGTTLLSYADRRWSQGGVYKSAGFAFAGETGPGYWWCRGVERFNRQGLQKHKLGKVLDKFDSSLTEVQNMHNAGYWRVWDCGSSRWMFTV